MLVHRATRAAGATGPPRDPARGGGGVRHRGGADRGAGRQGTYTRGGATEGLGDKIRTPGEGRRGRGIRYVYPGRGEEAMSDTGEEPTTEGLGNKVRTPWERGRGRV